MIKDISWSLFQLDPAYEVRAGGGPGKPIAKPAIYGRLLILNGVPIDRWT